jgi:hypothetical protein
VSIANTRAGHGRGLPAHQAVDDHLVGQAAQAGRRASRCWRQGRRPLAVKEGEKGQLLMKLWNDDQQAQSALAQTQVETARQRTTEACAQAANAEREAERQTALREKGLSPLA